MTEKPLNTRLGDEEDRFVERKSRGVQNADIRKTLVAFANSVPEGRTAALFIGIADDGVVVGVENADKLQKTVRRICQEQIYPRIEHNTEVIHHEDCIVVAVTVSASKNRPHFAGPAFVRVGSESVEATSDMLDELVASRGTKAGRILRDKDEVWTVIAMGRHIGDHVSMGENFREPLECKIESCDAHTVRLHGVGTGRLYAEPLEAVTIMYDEAKMRPMMMLR